MNGNDEWNGDYNPLEDSEERRDLYGALDSFRAYRRAAHYNTTHVRRQSFYALPTAHWNLLASPPFNFLLTLEKVDDAIDQNAEIASAILAAGLGSFNLNTSDWKGTATREDLNKARSTIRQFFRDWSAEGAPERDACLQPLLADLAAEFSNIPDRTDIRVLIPGAGLGRLVFEICRAGYSTEGNEISWHQLLASSWLLNHTAPGTQMALYPWALGFANHVSRERQLQRVLIPDVNPGVALSEASEGAATHAFDRLAMTAADFTVHYQSEACRGAFDAVVTLFFIDTAPNLVRYIETIRHCLKPGGVWMNFGPLLWHFEPAAPAGKSEGLGESRDLGIAEPGRVELTDEEIFALIGKFGFEVEKSVTGVPTGYVQDPESMLLNTYRASHWVARKKPRVDSELGSGRGSTF
ncbi:MAG: hypothetical protein M1829_005352 [Trizodia sp. TS-e1964]|nr:MAG: hypothetical protein M1829_005352 [Trizodia sp. TS-e1964]